MTFRDWWHANEASLAKKYYAGFKWTGIWQMLKLAYEAGAKHAEQKNKN